jgi:hypothetical protein
MLKLRKIGNLRDKKPKNKPFCHVRKNEQKLFSKTSPKKITLCFCDEDPLKTDIFVSSIPIPGFWIEKG